MVQMPEQNKRGKQTASEALSTAAGPAWPLPSAPVGDGGGAVDGGGTVVLGPEIAV